MGTVSKRKQNSYNEIATKFTIHSLGLNGIHVYGDDNLQVAARDGEEEAETLPSEKPHSAVAEDGFCNTFERLKSAQSSP
eukprot:60137-Amphidinium_carterae.2